MQNFKNPNIVHQHRWFNFTSYRSENWNLINFTKFVEFFSNFFLFYNLEVPYIKKNCCTLCNDSGFKLANKLDLISDFFSSNKHRYYKTSVSQNYRKMPRSWVGVDIETGGKTTTTRTQNLTTQQVLVCSVTQCKVFRIISITQLRQFSKEM